jgi:hypothetical protein
MHVVMTTTGKGQFHFGLNIIRDVDDSIGGLDDSGQIKAKLNLDLGSPSNFKLWDDLIVPNPAFNKDRYEYFVMGYLSGFDQFDPDNRGEDHSVYFKWDRHDPRRVRVFVSPLSASWVEPVSTKPAPTIESVIHDGAADMTDPPPSTTPPPPLGKR